MMSAAANIGTSNTPSLGTAEWNNMSFREKFGDSLFKTDNQRRLQEYAEADMALMQARSRRRFKVEDAKIDDKRDDLALGSIGRGRTMQAQSVEQSFGPTTGAQFKAMALRA